MTGHQRQSAGRESLPPVFQSSLLGLVQILHNPGRNGFRSIPSLVLSNQSFVVQGLVGCLVNSVTLSRLTSVIGKARERRTSRC